jgi:hypothetical protein
MAGLYRFKQQEKKTEFLLENCGLTASPAETININPPGPIKPSNQSTAGVTLCRAFYQCQQTVQKCWAKIILQTQTSMFLLHAILIRRVTY